MFIKEMIGELALAVTDPQGIVARLAARRAESRTARRSKKKAITLLRAAFLAFGSSEQLDLFTSPAAAVQQLVPTAVVEVTAQAFAREVAQQWSDQQIVALCDGIIRASLEAVQGYSNRERRKELLAWFAPSSDPKETLSFAFCCRIAGLDPEPIQSLLAREYKAEIREYVAELETAGPS